jgi:two-component system, sensor histidine kinase and response regulator
MDGWNGIENRRADRGAQVLVVEDVPVTREFLRALLEDAGYQVTLATTAFEGAAALKNELPDLVMLDLLLPDQNGLQVCRFLRSIPGGDDVPVLIITVDDRAETHAEAVRAGADDFLRKPLLQAELRTRVRSLLRLRQLRIELRRDRDAILSLQARKDELVQFVVHDLKNMTHGLLACVDFLEIDASQDQCEKQRRRISEITHGMVRMIQSMLDLSVHEQAGLQIQPERFQVEHWLKPITVELESLHQRRNQTMRIDVEPDLEVEADPQLLERLVLNLVENASKYGPEGATIHLVARGSEEGLRLSVGDEGERIPEALRDRVFDRYARATDLPGHKPGRGLGLAFCRLVAELHEGRIWLEDHEPAGNRFVLEIPLRCQPRATAG